MSEPIDIERAVAEHYSRAAGERAPELCCPIDYDPRYLEVIPDEILERDYGCGDPSRYVARGETVLDLGSGGGKICYIAAQVVGPEGRVIGVDMNDDMLGLAESHRRTVAERIGYSNVTFLKGKIQDLASDPRAIERRLSESPVRSAAELDELLRWTEAQRRHHPLVASESIDVVVSNCVLNLVRPEDKRQLFREIHRVLRPGGRAVISDIAGDEDVPAEMQADPDLWAGCISGAYREDAFLRAFEEAGFQGIEILHRDAEPWQVVRGIEFRSLTVRAFRGEVGPCLERNQAVIYKGPWSSVTDDDGHRLYRGERMAVCDKTFRRLTAAPYAEQVDPVPPLTEIPLDQATEFACTGDRRRATEETKGSDYRETRRTDDGCCGPGGGGC